MIFKDFEAIRLQANNNDVYKFEKSMTAFLLMFLKLVMKLGM